MGKSLPNTEYTATLWPDVLVYRWGCPYRRMGLLLLGMAAAFAQKLQLCPEAMTYRITMNEKAITSYIYRKVIGFRQFHFKIRESEFQNILVFFQF